MIELVSVAVLVENRVIGRDDELPWPSIPTDEEQYRNHIAGDPVILGRTTFESVRDDLPGSAQIVMSRSEQSFPVDAVHRVTSVEGAVDIAASPDTETAYIIGGTAIYTLFQPHLDRVVLSRVPGEYEGDTYHPERDTVEWELNAETDHGGFMLQEWVRSASSR